MKILSWNVNGLRTRIEHGFNLILEECDADIICLQEIKLQLQHEHNIFCPGYEIHWNCAKGESKYGTAILSKVHPHSVRYSIGFVKSDCEGRVTIAEFDSFYLVCYYSSLYDRKAPNSWLDLQDALRNCVCDLNNKKPVIICGDFNVAHQVIDSHTNKGLGCSLEERTKFTELLRAGFVDSFRYLYPDNKQVYSWWQREELWEENHGNRLDYFLVSEKIKNCIENVEIYKDYVRRDHCPIELVINI